MDPGSPLKLGSRLEKAMEELAEQESPQCSSSSPRSSKLMDQIRALEQSHTKLEHEMKKILEQREVALEALKKQEEEESPPATATTIAATTAAISSSKNLMNPPGFRRSLSMSPPPVMKKKQQQLLQADAPPRRTLSEKISEKDLSEFRRLTVSDDRSVGILQSMGQAVYMFTPSAEVTYWNRMAERLYGWSASEAIGRNIMELVVDQSSMETAGKIVARLCVGESWAGKFPLKKKSGEIFPALITNNPFYDTEGKLVGVIGVSSDARPFTSASKADWQQPWQIPFASTISSLANKIMSHLRGNLLEASRGMSSGSWTGRLWSWSAVETEEPESTNLETLNLAEVSQAQGLEINRQTSSMSSTSTAGSSSTSSRGQNLEELDENDISPDTLTLHDPIGQGSCATVYRGSWRELDVAVKVFHELQYNDSGLDDFKKEVSILKKLRHPNIVLFLGAACTPERVYIVTELMPRGSLFKLLHRKPTGLDWKRKLNMALDVARGMTYLHNCSPPIVHRDLKSTNLLVDRNFKVKVCDFSLSRLKHSNYLTGNARMGTSQWMPPEVLRSEPSNEKSDVYSFGVILWELATEEVPWKDSDPLQVIARVGFKDERLEIPENLDPQYGSIIQDCWKSAWEERPSFEELTVSIKEMLIAATRESS